MLPRPDSSDRSFRGRVPRTTRRAQWRRVPRAALALALLALPLLAMAALAGCAKSSDVERVAETNRVQDQRLRAVETDTAAALREQRTLLEQLQTDVRASKGQAQLANERTERLTNEQAALTAGLERTLAEQRKLSRKVEEELAQMQRSRLDSENDLDKMRTRVAELEKLLKSPMARLPDKTAADAEFRQAFYHLISGELDIAADAFAEFRKSHPKDERAVEALYRRGQAFFLMRRYDHALIPFFELVDKAPTHALATPTRWMLARALEETGDLKLAREFYAQLISEKTVYANDATRRVAFINRLFPRAGQAQDSAPKGK